LVAQFVREGRHGKPPPGDLPEEFAIGSAAHGRRVGEITGRDGKLGGFLASSVALLSVAAPAVFSVYLPAGGDGIVRRRHRVLESPRGRRCVPILGRIDRGRQARPQDHKQSQYSKRSNS